MTDTSIRAAVAAWLTDATAAEATYGHISTWDTSGVTDMASLFECCGNGAGYSSFNEDISAWDTSGVTTMSKMFYFASAFDQNLGWCVDDDVNLVGAFLGTQCYPSCGVKRGGCATGDLGSDGAATRSAALAALVLGAAAAAAL